MLKEIKYVFYIITIILFSFLSTKYYFSDEHIKKNYRMIDLVDKNIDTYSEKIPFLESNTKKIIEYVENELALVKIGGLYEKNYLIAEIDPLAFEQSLMREQAIFIDSANKLW